MPMRSLIFCICVFISSSSIIYAASFNCNKATTKTEKAICTNPELSALDDDLGFIFSAIYEISDEKDALVLEQREWLKARDNVGHDFVDLFSKISSRIENLSSGFNFLYCLNKLSEKTCSKVFLKIATAPIPVKLLSVGDDLSISLEFDGVKYDGSYSSEAKDFIYSWDDKTTVFYIWSSDLGLQILNPLTNEATIIKSMTSYQKNLLNVGMPHPITNAHLNYCAGWATDSRGRVSNFCKFSSLDLWNLELDRKLQNYEQRNEIKKDLIKTMSVLPNLWGKLELIEVFIKNLPDKLKD